jgi:hypothetical protein
LKIFSATLLFTMGLGVFFPLPLRSDYVHKDGQEKFYGAENQQRKTDYNIEVQADGASEPKTEKNKKTTQWRPQRQHYVRSPRGNMFRDFQSRILLRPYLICPVFFEVLQKLLTATFLTKEKR